MADIDENKLVLYAQMANLVKLVLPLMEINIKEVIENFSKMACNAHTICDSELMPLGTGIYPVISIINHSCLPNCVLVFEGRKAVLRAVKHITRGTEVSITYIETALTTTERKKLLKEQYFFDCTCHCCNTPHTVFLKGALEDNQDIILNGYRCKAKPCHGVLHHDSANNIYRCKVCGSTREKHSIDQINSKIKLLSERASRCVSLKDYLEAKDLYKNVEHLQLKIYNPLSICLMKTQEDIMKILIALNDWEGALIYCRLTIPIYQRVYPAIHPLVGLQYYTCGKLEWLLRQAGEALQSYTKAVDILRITHGTTTPFMRELLLKIEEANADARLLQRKTALLQ